MLHKLEIDRKSGKPVSSQLASFIRGRIENREIKAGEKLPTTRDFVEITGLGSQTIRNAMMELEAEGLVESSRGRGTFVKKSSSEGKRVKKLAMLGAFSNDKNSPEILYPQTMAGAFNECEKRKISAHIFPPYVDTSSSAEVLKTLSAERCQGVLWFRPSADELQTIRDIQNLDIPVVLASQSGFARSFSCVAIDEFSGGQLLADYFVEQSCPKVVMFWEKVTKRDDERGHGGNGGPLNLNKSLSDSLTHKKNCQVVFEEQTLPHNNPHTHKKLLEEKIQHLTPGDGILLENSQNLQEAIKDNEACKLLSKYLSKYKLGIISSEGVVDNLLPLSREMSFKVLIMPVQKLGQVMVQKLIVNDCFLLKQGLSCIPVKLRDSDELFKPE